MVSDSDSAAVQGAPASSPASEAGAGAPVMVVEDNEINQDILAAQLEALGIAYAVYDDGMHGLQAWRNGRYSLVLTDCDMPHMDGYEMTACIRALEAERGMARTPIIAVTGNERASELEACRAAGMDACLAKPVELDELKAALEQWVGASAGHTPVAFACAPPAPEAMPGELASAAGNACAVFDPRQIYDTIGRDPTTILEFVGMALRDLEPRIEGIAPALAQDDLLRAARHAHAIKGTAGAIGAGRVSAAARALEEAGKQGDGGRCRALLAQLCASFGELRGELERQPW